MFETDFMVSRFQYLQMQFILSDFVIETVVLGQGICFDTKNPCLKFYNILKFKISRNEKCPKPTFT